MKFSACGDSYEASSVEETAWSKHKVTSCDVDTSVNIDLGVCTRLYTYTEGLLVKNVWVVRNLMSDTMS